MKVLATPALGIVGLAVTAGCTAPVGVGGMVNVPRDSPAKCERICADMSTTLAAVVVMASNVGCVCNPPAGPSSPATAPAAPAPTVPPPAAKTAAITGGMAAEILQEKDEQRRHNHATSQ
jgi:hypothetical protein